MENTRDNGEQTINCSLIPDEWNYLAEGNQHLILKYNGDNAQFIGTVLRLQKISEPLPQQVDKKEHLVEEFLQESLLKEIVTQHLYKYDPVLERMTRSV